jgi:hypothetical protein
MRGVISAAELTAPSVATASAKNIAVTSFEGVATRHKNVARSDTAASVS